jgi:hypothetical protein
VVASLSGEHLLQGGRDEAVLSAVTVREQVSDGMRGAPRQEGR